jgi:hypothetical protein
MRRRRASLIVVGVTILLTLIGSAMPQLIEESSPLDITFPWQQTTELSTPVQAGSAREALASLPIKGRSPKTGYERDQFGSGWATVNGCSTRDIIMYRDMTNVTFSDECSIATGTLNDTYTGKAIQFTKADASIIQIDHVVALSDAWQSGAQQLSKETRQQLANDPLELLAVSGKENQTKSDSNAASWLPPNKAFRCQYIARQVAVKQKYSLWVTAPEHEAMNTILATCPSEKLPTL